MGGGRPLLPWEIELDYPIGMSKVQDNKTFNNAREYVLLVLYHELMSFNSIILKKIASDTIVTNFELF